ncbi:hypothetical protein BKA56DRAFT_237416 [Ilyonectria sp. MPI-CAGE-AT-0026]|nr:hypothetical protein BKA56DRAFT_237416 [Ilyonectria sp. MPI-CAGE-AT-0026]
MPHTTREASRLQKHLVQVPARWTDDQTKFLRFSFPSCPTIMPTATAACGHEDGLSEVRWQLAKQRFSFRHSAIAELLTSPTCPFKSSNNLIFQFGRREQPLNCVVLSPRNAHQRKVRISAFVDEGCIRRTRLLNAKSPRQRQALRLDQYHPYITALLIAVAQAQDDREESGYVTVSCPIPLLLYVLYSESSRLPFCSPEIAQRKTSATSTSTQRRFRSPYSTSSNGLSPSFLHMIPFQSHVFRYPLSHSNRFANVSSRQCPARRRVTWSISGWQYIVRCLFWYESGCSGLNSRYKTTFAASHRDHPWPLSTDLKRRSR